jgi:acetyltransferase-like isoleucine patch superfamily enzyme
MEQRKPREDLDPQGSKHSGLMGLFERAFRKMKVLVHSSVLVLLAGIYFSCIGLCLTPGFFLFDWVSGLSEGMSAFPRFFLLGASVAAGFFSYGLCMIMVIPAVVFILRARPVAFRGPYYSAETARWYVSNAFLYLVRYTFLELITPTPMSHMFYRWMGMKIGKGSHLNTTHVSDPSMIELGEKVTIGGSVVIVGHYGQGGYLVIAPVKIEDGATVGLRAIIMGDVVIGAGAKILPNSVLLPKTRVPAGELWGGVPARRIDPDTLKRAA